MASITSGRYLESIFGMFMLLTAGYMLVKKPAADMADTIPSLSLPTMVTGGFSIGFIASIIGTVCCLYGGYRVENVILI